MDIFDLSISEFEQENISKEKYSTKELSEDNSLYIEFLSLENSSECMELGVAA